MSKVTPSRGNIDYTQHTGAKGGAALGRTRDFLKANEPVKQDYAKTGKGGELSKTEGDKSLKVVKPRD